MKHAQFQFLNWTSVEKKLQKVEEKIVKVIHINAAV